MTTMSIRDVSLVVEAIGGGYPLLPMRGRSLDDAAVPVGVG